MIPIPQYLKLALAHMRAKPGHGPALSVTLALGIGASAAIFTLRSE